MRRKMMACEEIETEESSLSVFMVTHLLQSKHLSMIPLKCVKNARLIPLTSDFELWCSVATRILEIVKYAQ